MLDDFIIGAEKEAEKVDNSQQAAGGAFASASSKGVVRLGQKRKKPKKKA